MVFHSSTIAMMHGPINIRSHMLLLPYKIGYVTNEDEAKPIKFYRRYDSIGVVRAEMKQVASELFGSS